MSFKLNLKKTDKGFAVRLRSYALEDRLDAGKADKDYVETYVPMSEWHRHGFDSSMTYEQAREHLKSINSQVKLRDSQEFRARAKYIKDKEHDEVAKSAYLPKYLVDEFEKKLRDDSFAEDYDKSKTYFHWRTTLRLISALEIDPVNWHDNKRTIIKKLEGYAPSTIKKTLHFLNAYGSFYCKKMGKYYEKVQAPKGVEVGRISDKYLDKTGGTTKEAKGISLAVMAKLLRSDDMTDDQKNWCIVCLGFAVRPIEMDSVLERDSDKVITGKNSVKIYQSKLTSLPRNKRYKEVMITHPFQKDALSIYKADMPLVKPTIVMIRKVLGDEYGLYSFRKGYTDIMITLGESIERISMDLGHNSIETTWKSYRKRITAD